MLKRIFTAFRLSLLLIFVIIGVVADWAFTIAWQQGAITVPSAPPSKLELMPESSAEWSEQHLFAIGGIERETRVRYRDFQDVSQADRGRRFWRPDHTLQEQIITGAGGSVRLHAVYAADGKQVISGRAYRLDGTLIWEAKLADTLVTTTIYWTDGKTPFAVKQRRIGGDRTDDMYYYRSGQRWMHYVGPVVRDSNPGAQEVWNEQGVLVFAHLAGLNGTSTDLFFNDDGTPSYKQYWGTYEFCAEEGCSGPQKVLLQAEILSGTADGTSSRDVIMVEGGYAVQRVRDRLSAGGFVEYSLRYDGTIVTRQQTDAAGNTAPAQQLKPGPNADKIVVDKKFLSDALKTFDPEQAWRADPGNPSKDSPLTP